MPIIGARFYSQLDMSLQSNDVLYDQLSKEVENGRLFRMMCKLGAINERPEYVNYIRFSSLSEVT